MTTIVAKKEKDYIHICSDTRVSQCNERVDNHVGGIKCNKLLKISNDLYFANCGSALLPTYFKIFSKTNLPKDNSLDSIIEYCFKFIRYLKDEFSMEKLNSSGFIVFKNKIFSITWDYYEVFEIDDYIADGSGRQYAITALHLGKNAKEAVEISCKLDSYSELPIQEYKCYYKKKRNI